MAKNKPTLPAALREASRTVRRIELLVKGLTGVNRFITDEIDDNINPELRRLKRTIAAARKLAGPDPDIIVGA